MDERVVLFVAVLEEETMTEGVVSDDVLYLYMDQELRSAASVKISALLSMEQASSSVVERSSKSCEPYITVIVQASYAIWFTTFEEKGTIILSKPSCCIRHNNNGALVRSV